MTNSNRTKKKKCLPVLFAVHTVLVTFFFHLNTGILIYFIFLSSRTEMLIERGTKTKWFHHGRRTSIYTIRYFLLIFMYVWHTYIWQFMRQTFSTVHGWIFRRISIPSYDHFIRDYSIFSFLFSILNELGWSDVIFDHYLMFIRSKKAIFFFVFFEIFLCFICRYVLECVRVSSPPDIDSRLCKCLVPNGSTSLCLYCIEIAQCTSVQVYRSHIRLKYTRTRTCCCLFSHA